MKTDKKIYLVKTFDGQERLSYIENIILRDTMEFRYMYGGETDTPDPLTRQEMDDIKKMDVVYEEVDEPLSYRLVFYSAYGEFDMGVYLTKERAMEVAGLVESRRFAIELIKNK